MPGKGGSAVPLIREAIAKGELLRARATVTAADIEVAEPYLREASQKCACLTRAWTRSRDWSGLTIVANHLAKHW
ncbi:hypothetical protein KEU06_23445 [Pseudaminobacter sp. 19-2017]|uniref:Uncharacterized protein n=1 Tax=Pseudaminobacter soli (ex Zhang et al. 2022) TaxID=2831468 RepID=A0A942E260_9HYPH|nr:hypothetical protein [Pseudaminobacter soli]MBS3651577.1 hypothetical protein [Pseudaminobacter soli]